MRRLPKPIMIGLAQAIMIACVAALGTPLRGEGGAAPFYPPAFGSCELFVRLRALADGSSFHGRLQLPKARGTGGRSSPA